MNDVTWPLAIFGAWALVSVPFVWLAVHWFRASARERALDRAVEKNLPLMWRQVHATLKRRQP